MLECTDGEHVCVYIHLFRYGTEFLRNAHRLLAVNESDESSVNVQFKENGYLFLATEKGRHILEANHRLQQKLGSRIQLLKGSAELKSAFPYLHTDVREYPHLSALD